MKKVLLFLAFTTYIYAKGLYPNTFKVYNNPNNHMLTIKENKQYSKLLNSNNTDDLKKFITKFKGKNLYRPLKHPDTLLSHAVGNIKSIEIAKILLENGSDPDAISLRGDPHSAISISIETNNFQAVQLLLDYNASLNYQYKKVPMYCTGSPLRLPIFSANSKNMIKFLIEKGADISLHDTDGKTILDYIDPSYYHSPSSKYDPSLKPWLIKKYNLPTKYFRCGSEYPYFNKIVKVVHTADGYKEYDANDILVYEVKNGKVIFQIK